MHWGKISVVSVIASVMAYGASAEEGVVIDLGVLNNLDAGYYDAPEPLFPVLPKQPNHQIKKKNVVKAAKPLPTAKIKKSTAPIVVEKSDTTKKATSPKINTAKKEKDDFVVVVDREPVAESIEKALPQTVEQKPAVSFNVKPEEMPVIAETPSFNKKIVAEKDSAQKIEEPKEEIAVKNVENVARSPKRETSNETIALKEDTGLENSVNSETTSSEVNGNSVAENNEISAQQDGIIKFESDSDILNAEQQELLDKIVSGFSNDKTAKIAIYAYNFDDKVDSFRKKRMTLNRAIEVRSYLLKKGFKNFNIKVVNISGDSKKVNCVELKEI